MSRHLKGETKQDGVYLRKVFLGRRSRALSTQESCSSNREAVPYTLLPICTLTPQPAQPHWLTKAKAKGSFEELMGLRLSPDLSSSPKRVFGFVQACS